MPYKPGDTLWEEFTVLSSAGALVNADSLPTATMARNGADDAGVVLTVTNVATGRYKVTGTIPATYAPGDKIQVFIAATISTVASGSIIRSDVLDSNRLADIVVLNGTAQAGAAGTVTLPATASAVDNFYKDTWIKIAGGTGAGQVRYCSASVGASKVASVSPNWVVAPDNTSVILILPAAQIDKTGCQLAANGLDVVAITAPTGTPTTFTQYVVWLVRRFLKKTSFNKTTGNLICYADDGVTPISTQVLTDDGTVQTEGAAA